jgi:D-alanyl-D-alanine carboxypeptidase
VFAPGGWAAHRFDHHSPADLVRAAVAAPRLSKQFHYATTNYVLAGMLIERVTGHRYADEIKARILRPLGLTRTSLPGDQSGFDGRHLSGYAHLDAKDTIAASGTLKDVTALNPSLVWAGGEMLSTVDDLNTFFSALVGGRLLPPAQQAAMLRTVPADVIPGAAYGLGLFRMPLSCGGYYWTHGGDGLGYQSRGGYTPDGRAVSVVHTSSPATPQQTADALKLIDTALCA